MKDSLRKVKAILVFLVLMSSVLSAMHARLLYYHVDWTVTCHIHNLYGLYHKLEQTTMLMRYVPNLIFQYFFFILRTALSNLIWLGTIGILL